MSSQASSSKFLWGELITEFIQTKYTNILRQQKTVHSVIYGLRSKMALLPARGVALNHAPQHSTIFQCSFKVYLCVFHIIYIPIRDYSSWYNCNFVNHFQPNQEQQILNNPEEKNCGLYSTTLFNIQCLRHNFIAVVLNGLKSLFWNNILFVFCLWKHLICNKTLVHSVLCILRAVWNIPARCSFPFNTGSVRGKACFLNVFHADREWKLSQFSPFKTSTQR